jgi:predicted ATPase
VGRIKEIAEIKHLLKSSRLVVLTGPGGCGKSRLALQVAAKLVESYRDGVWLVEFASISVPALVANAIVQVLQVSASGDASLVDVLKRFLARKHLLLLLDNFEHLPEATPLVGELLAAAPQVTVLATSRERLHVYGEQEYPVHPLSLPDLHIGETKDQVLAYEAVNLFVQRARAAQPGFTADEAQISSIARICVRLDGLPLAIELAASQVKIYLPATLAQRLEDGQDALPSGPRDLPARQRTLRATLDWSYNLLQEGEKILFARLAVFSGGSTLEGILSVCGRGLHGDAIEILSALVEKNLVYPRQGSDGELRFTMLETIHEYATERLSARGEVESIRILHADYFAHMAEAAEKEMRGARQEYWFARLRAEQNNLHSVFTWSFNGNGNEHGLRLAASLQEYWYYNGLAVEGRRWIDLGLARSTNAAPALLAGVLRCAGHIAYTLSDLRRGKELLHRALDLYKQLGDERNAAWSMVFLGGLFMEDPLEYLQGIALCTQGLEVFRKLEDKPGTACALNNLGELARLQGDYEAARRYYEESLSVTIETGERQREAIMFSNLCYIAYHQQNYKLAMQFAQRSIIVARELTSEYRQACFLAALAGPTAALGRPERAARLLGASHARFEALGTRHQPADQPELDLFEAAARNQLGDKAFQEAWQAGQTLTLQEAVSLALADLEMGE